MLNHKAKTKTTVDQLCMPHLPHGDDSIRHSLDAVPPLLEEGLVLEDSVDNPGAVGGWIGVHRADDEGHLEQESCREVNLLSRLGVYLTTNCQLYTQHSFLK